MLDVLFGQVSFELAYALFFSAFSCGICPHSYLILPLAESFLKRPDAGDRGELLL
jgi:hypothetical protein